MKYSLAKLVRGGLAAAALAMTLLGGTSKAATFAPGFAESVFSTGWSEPVGILFGRNPGRMERVSGDAVEARTATPARLTVYDAPLDLESITPQMRENLDDEINEVKSENAIDRITCQANARTLERVPAGARFRVRLVLDVLCNEDKELVAPLLAAVRLLEDDALGGGGSRGSGRVRFANWSATWRGKGFYLGTAQEETLVTAAPDTAALHLRPGIGRALVRSDRFDLPAHDVLQPHGAGVRSALRR